MKKGCKMARILVVDDSGFMRSIVRRMVEGLGHEVIAEAENGIEAIAQYKLHSPDVVTMDITMPEMDGLVALQHIIDYDAKASVVMATAMGQDAMVKESVSRGAKDFLAKPFNEEEIARILERLTTKS